MRRPGYKWHNVFERCYERRDVSIVGRIEEMDDGKLHISVTVDGKLQSEDPEYRGPYVSVDSAKNACWKRMVRVSTAIPYR